MADYVENLHLSDYYHARLTYEQIREMQYLIFRVKQFYDTYYQNVLAPCSQSTISSYSMSDSYSELPETQDTIMTVATPPIDSPWIERKISTEKYQATRGTPLTLSSIQDSQSQFNIARNIFEDFSQVSSLSNSQSTQIDMGPFEPSYSMVKLGLERKFLKKTKKVRKNNRYPVRNKTSPIKWWLGERTVYDENGLLVGKDLRR